MIFLETISYQIKCPIPRIFCLFFIHFSVKSHNLLLQNITGYSHCFRYCPELDDKMLLVKKLHICVIEHGDIKKVLTCKLCPY